MVENYEEDDEMIIELEISKESNENKIYILCNKNKLKEDIQKNEEYYNTNNLKPPKAFELFNIYNTKIYLNDKEINFNYKLNIEKKGTYKVKIKSKVKLFSLASMFYNCNNITKIKFIKINTKNVTDMSRMFCYCSNLAELDLSLFNTNNVTNMKSMFYFCTNLTKINLSSFNTNNVVDMSQMFLNCEKLDELNLTSFNTNNVVNMSHMFFLCKKLKKLDLSSFITNNVINMKYMFYYCENLAKLNLSSFNFNNVFDMEKMFLNCNFLNVVLVNKKYFIKIKNETYFYELKI